MNLALTTRVQPEEQPAVLLVGTSPERLAAIEAALAPLQQPVVRATSRQEALECLIDGEVAAVVDDGGVLTPDGGETVASRRGKRDATSVPILVVVDRAQDGRAAPVCPDAVVDSISRPFDPRQLRARISLFLELHKLRRQVEVLGHHAFHDPLTDLPNRALLLDRLQMVQARMKRRQLPYAVLFVDLDGFKAVNDSLGHHAGDRVLVEIAARLRNAVRPADTVARFGGDEFAILCEDAQSERDATRIAQRVASTVNTPVNVAGQWATVTASIGIVVTSGTDRSPEELIHQADQAMYRARKEGRSHVAVCGGGIIRASISGRLPATSGLGQAVARNELRLYYQPQVQLDRGRVTGLEALVRWQHPSRGLLLPEEFIPAAEQSDLIVEIGGWVLEEACRQAERWRDAPSSGAPLSMAVNLSPRQLGRPEIVEVATEALARSGADPASLCFEITEGILAEDTESTIQTLRDLRRIGAKIAIDDFGTGYSSIAYLRRFPVDILKVDGSFVEDLGVDRRSSVLASAVVSLAHGLGLTAIAEGVATREQLVELRAIGFDAAQGAYFAEAQPADAIEELMRASLGDVQALGIGRSLRRPRKSRSVRTLTMDKAFTNGGDEDAHVAARALAAGAGGR